MKRKQAKAILSSIGVNNKFGLIEVLCHKAIDKTGVTCHNETVLAF